MNLTPWQLSGRTFNGDLKIGQEGQNVVNCILRQIEHVVKVDDIGEEQYAKDDEIDSIVSFDNGKVMTVEIKTDEVAANSNNLAFERFSNRNPGGLWRCKADRIMFYIPHKNEIHVFHTYKVHKYMHELERKRAPLCPMGGGALGWLAPIKELKRRKITKCIIYFDEIDGNLVYRCTKNIN